MMHHCTNVVIIIGISVAWYLTDEDGLTAPCFTWAKKCIYQTSEIYLKRVLYSLDTTCMHTCVQKECNVDEMREGGGLWKKEDRIQSTVQRWMVENRLDYNRIIWLEMVENRLDYNRINWLEMVDSRITTLTFVYLWLILILLIPSLDLFSHIPLLTVPPPHPHPTFSTIFTKHDWHMAVYMESNCAVQ